MVGQTKKIVLNAKHNRKVETLSVQGLLEKDFKREKVLEAYRETLQLLKDCFTNKEMKPIHKIRNNMEMILYKEKIIAISYEDFLDQLQQIDSKLSTNIK